MAKKQKGEQTSDDGGRGNGSGALPIHVVVRAMLLANGCLRQSGLSGQD